MTIFCRIGTGMHVSTLHCAVQWYNGLMKTHFILHMKEHTYTNRYIQYTRYTHAHHVPHAEHVERSDEMVKRSRDYVGF